VSVRIPLRNRDGDAVAWAIVDDEDAHLAEITWSLVSKGYVARCVKIPGTRRNISYRLHRVIMGLEHGDERQVDHINRDKLDNRRANLRVVSARVQAQNCDARRGGTSKYRGVSLTVNGTWNASAQVGRVKYHLGRFATELEAHRAASAFRREHMPFSEEAAA
jgi:hypothetical protein